MSAQAITDKAIRYVQLGRNATAEEILNAAQETLGPEAYVELGFDLVYGLSCLECGRSNSLSRRLGTVPVGEALCPWCTPSCCTNCGYSLIETISQSPESVFPDHVNCAACYEANNLVLRDNLILNRIEPGSPVLDLTLVELSVPMWDILEAKSADCEASIFLQLDGDKSELLAVSAQQAV